MSTAGATAFLSWVRRGLATRIVGQPATRPQVAVSLTVSGISPDPNIFLNLATPAEVVGFDERAVSRVFPHPDAPEAETNLFPLLELHEPDLPWRYSPTGASGDQVIPWLCLIVLKMESGQEEGSYSAPANGGALGQVAIEADVPLPLLSQSWAWAHAQLAFASPDGSQVNPDTVAGFLSIAPQAAISRLLCPRRLDPDIHYTAFLVPTFQQGVDAGLGRTSTASLQTQAWTSNTSGAGLTLPVYYKWNFRTGDGGDFESLVRRLKPSALPSSLGLRDMDVSNPGGGLPPATTNKQALGVEGALKAPSTVSTSWSPSDSASFVAALATLVNSPADVVAPPVYGRWPARWTPTLSTTPLQEIVLPWGRAHGRWPPKRRLQSTLPTNAPPVWLQRLNEDPRNRVAAGLGAQVVRDEQRQLIASAWQQLGAIRDANALLRKAQLARELSVKIHTRYVLSLGADATLLLAKPVLGRVKQGSQSILNLARNSPLRQALLSGVFRRLIRPLGALGRRQGKPDQGLASILSNVNSLAWVLQGGAPAPTNLPTHGWLKGLGARRGPRRFIPDANKVNVTLSTWLGPPSASTLQNAPPQGQLIAWDPVFDPYPTQWGTSPSNDTPSMSRFRTAAVAFAGRDKTPVAGATLTKLDIPTLTTTVQATLDPRITIPAALASRVTKASGFTYAPSDPIEPVQAYPDFSQPMYKPLAEQSQDWILPGLADVPAESVSLAVTNQSFIEAYMVGLNHEMARELLWNEYPTDQRGSFFRQFWDPTGYVTTDDSLAAGLIPETLRDITPIHTWLSASDLGVHKPAGGTQLVLVVRGDVFRRYPGTTIYAVKATFTGGVPQLPDESDPKTHMYPAFTGRLSPDVAFFGFTLSLAEAKGDGTSGAPGYFFGFQEQAGEPHFGLDADSSGAVTAWSDLAWPQFNATSRPKWWRGGFRTMQAKSIDYLDLTGYHPSFGSIPPDPAVNPASWGSRSADLAYITSRKPVRLLIHASEMLP